MLEGASKIRFNEDNDDDDDNDGEMEMAIVVMTMLDLFPVLMLNADEPYGLSNLS